MAQSRLLGGDTGRPSELHARLCHAFCDLLCSTPLQRHGDDRLWQTFDCRLTTVSVVAADPDGSEFVRRYRVPAYQGLHGSHDLVCRGVSINGSFNWLSWTSTIAPESFDTV